MGELSSDHDSSFIDTVSDVIPEIPSELIKQPRKRNKKTKLHRRKLRIITMRANGSSHREIARAIGVNEKTVRFHLEGLEMVLQNLPKAPQYRDLKSDILSATELTVLQHTMTEEKLKKAKLLDGAKTFEIINKANRLEQGQSTENFAHKFQGAGNVVTLLDPSDD